MNEDRRASHPGWAWSLIAFAWLACLAELPLVFLVFLVAAMSASGPHAPAWLLALLALGPMLAAGALTGAFFCGRPSGWRVVAMLVPGALSLAEMGFMVLIWVAG